MMKNKMCMNMMMHERFNIIHKAHREHAEANGTAEKADEAQHAHTHTHTATTQDTNANTGRRMKRRKLYHINNNNIRHSAATHKC